MSRSIKKIPLAILALPLVLSIMLILPFTKVSAEELIDETPTEEEMPVEDTIAPVLITKDVTRDEGESVPDFSEFIASNPENLAVSCTVIDSSELVVSQPAANKLIPVTCSIEDEAGNVTTSTSNLIVNNVVPNVVIIADPSTSFAEGSYYNIIANITYGSPKLTYNWLADCSGAGELNSVGVTSSAVFYNAVGSHYCGITVVDADGDVASASILVNVTPKSTENNSAAPTTVENTTTETPETNSTNDSNNTDTETSSEAEVQGAETENPVSTTESNSTNNSTNSTTNSTVSTQTTSPLVIICLVAGAILIIGLLLFLFFRGSDDEDEEESQS